MKVARVLANAATVEAPDCSRVRQNAGLEVTTTMYLTGEAARVLANAATVEAPNCSRVRQNAGARSDNDHVPDR